MTNKRIMKALKDLNAYVDDDRQKLCDRLYDLELSHKRKIKLLKYCLSYLDAIPGGKYRDILVSRIEQELSYSSYRVNWKKKGKKNG